MYGLLYRINTLRRFSNIYRNISSNSRFSYLFPLYQYRIEDNLKKKRFFSHKVELVNHECFNQR